MEPEWVRHLPPGDDPASIDLLRQGSLPGAFAHAWANEPDHPVIHDGARWLHAGELDERTRIVAGRLAHAGLHPGDRVITSAATSAELVVAHLAALRLGLVVVPMNDASREREVAHVARDCAPAAAVVDDATRGAWIEAAATGRVVVTSPAVDLPDGDPPVLDVATAGDGALLCYTSGTTGTPKGALLTHGNTLASCEALRIAWRWTPDDRLVLALPLFHVHGLQVGLHGSLLAGGSVLLLPRFDVAGVLDAADANAATLFFGVPTMFARLASSDRVAELGALRLCVSGSAPLPAALHGHLLQRTGTHVLERYGLTETLINTANPYDGERRAGTVGFPLPGVAVRLADDDGSGEDRLGGDGTGEILVRGPNVFPGYWNRPEETRNAFAGEWFRTGDVGAFDDDGYLSIVGRNKELIISGGFNVYPREVEDVLLTHPCVAEVAVVGVPSDEWGETVTAVVVTDGPVDEGALLAHAAASLAPYKQPRRVRFVTELPRNALGKVLRHEL